MAPPTIRPARIEEYGEVARVWMNGWASAPEYRGRDLGRKLLAFTRQQLPDEISLRCVRENEKAWRWYEREGFVFEKEQVAPATGFVMKYYRWKKEGVVQ
jgi:ribosomal protein S18 acetylase RimI-like enzyme